IRRLTALSGWERCLSPETHRVAAGRVVFTVAPCSPDRRRGRRPSERPASVSQTQGGHTDDGQDLAAAGTTARPEWVGGQEHYKPGYTAAIRLMAEKVVGRA